MASGETPTTEFPRSIGEVAARSLARAGYTRFDHLTKVSREALLAIHGVGPKSVGALEEELKARGLGFGEEASAGAERIREAEGQARPQIIVPTLRYRDAAAAIAFLESAFGFEPRHVSRGDDGSVAHAEILYGSAVVMIGTQRDDWMRTLIPEEVGGVTSSAYLVVEDVEAHHTQAVHAGAEIVRPLEETSYGSREYSARDPEGHLWHFGTYDPSGSAGTDEPSRE